MPFPFPDALQEFSIETSAVSSRFGTHPGATVNVVTKSGSNAFHGDLFDYLRNGAQQTRSSKISASRWSGPRQSCRHRYGVSACWSSALIVPRDVHRPWKRGMLLYAM
jgi:hypothetical protein